MASRTQSVSKIFVWILLALLILGLAGFGATNLGGNIRSVGQVGTRDIPVQEYARALQNDIRNTSSQFGQQLTFQQAELFGIPQQTLGRIITEKAMDFEAANLGISVGDAVVRDQLMEISSFHGLDGNFDRDTYAYALQNAGLSEAGFENQLRDETARSLLQAAVLTGNKMPEPYSNTLISFLLEQRSGVLVQLKEENLTSPLSPATADQLRAFYEENIDQFSLPESKSITYLQLTPDLVRDTISIDEAALLALYEKNASQYFTPEKRDVDRLVFLDAAVARESLQKLTSDSMNFDELVESRGLSVDDVKLGNVAAAELGGVADDIFSADVGDIIGPLNSDLGPALFRIRGITAEKKIGFEEAREELFDELSEDKARRLIETQASMMDDLFASGATLEEAAEESDAQLGNIRFFPGVKTDIAEYSEFREAAQNLTEADFPSIIQLTNGGVFALRLDQELSASPEPFEDVEQAVAAALRNEMLMQALMVEAEKRLSSVNEVSTLATLGLSNTAFENLTRDQNIDLAPPNVTTEVFNLELNGTTAIESDLSVFMVQVLGIAKANDTTEDAVNLREQIKSQLGAGLSQDLIETYLTGVQSRAEISLNQQALNAVHANFQ